MNNLSQKHTIVIVGGGAAGLELATSLGHKPSRTGHVAPFVKFQSGSKTSPSEKRE